MISYRYCNPFVKCRKKVLDQYNQIIAVFEEKKDSEFFAKLYHRYLFVLMFFYKKNIVLL